MMAKVKRSVLSFLLCVVLMGSIFPVNSAAAEKDVIALTYHAGKYDVCPESDKNAMYVMIDDKKYYYSDDFDSQDIATKLLTMDNQNVVYELHDGIIAKAYTMDEVLSQEVTVEPGVKDGLTYRKGKFSQKSFELAVKVSNHLKGDFKENDLLRFLSETEKGCLYSILKNLEIQPSDEVDFGSSGWWMWKEYEKNISENVNDVIRAEETKEYRYTVNLHNDGVLNQKEYSISFYTTPTFDTGKGLRVESKIPVGNLDYQKEKTEEKKATSNSGQSVVQAATKLDGIQNAIQFSNNIFSADQTEQINESVNIWMSELLLAKYVEKSELQEYISDKKEEIINKWLNKLGVDTSVLAIPGEIRATSHLKTQAKDGTKVFIQFNIDMFNFDFGNSGMPTFATGSGTATVYNMDGEKLDSSVILPAYANVCAFCEQLQEVAKNTIFNGAKEYLGIFGRNAEATAEALSSKMMEKILNNKYAKKVFKRVNAKDVKAVLKKIIVEGEKKVNNKIFEIVTTPSEESTEVSIKCPVDVKIFDNDGNLCGIVKDNIVDSTYDDIFVNVVGEQKNIYLVGDDYSLEMTGTDDGSMNYVVKELDDEGNTAREIAYENIKLSNGCKYYSYVPEAVNHNSVLFDLIDDKEAVILPTKGADTDFVMGTIGGKCGENVYWELSEEGTLRIYGNGNMSFYGEPGWRLYHDQITAIVIEEGVTNIASDAFYGCSNLVSVKMPDSLIRIGYSSFLNCTSLEQINLPDNLQELARGAFIGTKWFMQQSDGILYLDYWLLGYKHGDGIEEGYKSYQNQTDIFQIKEGTIGIAQDAMYDSAYEFKTVIFPESIKYICSNSFFGKDDCCTYVFKGQPKVIEDDSIVYTWNGMYKDGIVFLGKPGGSVEEYASKFGIKFISTDSYEYDERFSVRVDDETGGLIIEGIMVEKNAEIPTQMYGMEVNCIGHYASSKSKNMETLILPDTIKKIKYGAFKECTKLKKVIIPDSVEVMGQSVFDGCEGLEEVILGAGLREMGAYDGIISSSVGDFENCKNLKKVTIKSMYLKEIPKGTFLDCCSLKSIDLPDGLSSIGDYAFYCTGLRNIKLPQSLTYIGQSAFCHSEFRSVKIPEKVINIGKDAFHASDYSVTLIGRKGSAAEIYTKNNKGYFIDIDSYVAVEGMSLNKTTLSLKIAEKGTLIASVFPENATLGQVIWSSDHPEVASVYDGDVIAIAAGTAVIMAQAEEQTVSCEVTVTDTSETTENPNPTIKPDISGSLNPAIKPDIPGSLNPVIKPDTTDRLNPTDKPDTTDRSKPTGKPDTTKNPRPTGGVNIINSPSAGTMLRDSKNKAIYKVTARGRAVAFYKVKDKESTEIVVPSTVTINGIKYKVTVVSDNAFNGCKKLKSVVIGNYVTAIGNKAFFKCISLKKITIPAGIRKIGKQSLYGCKKLKNITIQTTKLTRENIGNKAFKGIYSNVDIKAPRQKLKSYKKILRVRGIGKCAKIHT